MKFKVGDIVRGRAGKYGITNHHCTGKVTKVTSRWLTITITKHDDDDGYVGESYDELDPAYFDLLKRGKGKMPKAKDPYNRVIVLRDKLSKKLKVYNAATKKLMETVEDIMLFDPAPTTFKSKKGFKGIIQKEFTQPFIKMLINFNEEAYEEDQSMIDYSGVALISMDKIKVYGDQGEYSSQEFLGYVKTAKKTDLEEVEEDEYEEEEEYL